MKISIITAVYNGANTIEETIKSVLAQTYADIEYIVVDGNSSDGTIDIVRRYEPLFGGRMRWVSEPDKGIYDAMNKGINMATGDVVGIINSDDFFSSNDIIAKVAEAIPGYDAVYGDIHFVDKNNPQRCKRYYSSRIFRPALLRFGFMPAHPSFYARKSVFERYGLYSLNYRIASDYDMMVRLFYTHRISAKYLPLDFVAMRPGGISTKNIRHRLITTKEDVLACKRNGLYTNFFLVCFKYFIKVFEFKL